MDLSRIRHDLHEIPEIGFNEFKTQAYIMSLLDRLSVSYEKVAGTGLLAKWKKVEGPFVLFRSDMDALPVLKKQMLHSNLHMKVLCMHAAMMFI
ncbi:hypothetical protein [Mesotoga sp. Brook.08.YT.4.2.5.1]|uniref:hypothetical protein n=1 Tax=Mesotoga sp. Brook.08.YT.4.2.5.1 TaxID=1421001 RepID=UPI002155C648|nr:hypothetical protein [Mesotoga sp. Brook.08.YT.4.2.5.1]